MQTPGHPPARQRRRTAVLGVAVLVLLCSHGRGADEWREAMQPFLRTHCYDCHADGVTEGGLDLAHLPADLTSPEHFATWERIHDRVAAGEMPPVEAEQPAVARRQRFLRGLHDRLSAAHEAAKQTVLRRLNNREYENTLNDLFGTHVELAATLPADGRSDEFDNVGAALGLSRVQLQRYMEGIESVIDASVVSTVTQPEATVTRASYADTRGAEKWLNRIWLHREDGAVVFFKRYGYPTGMLREANVRESGRYRVRVTGYAYQSESPITFSIGATTFARGLKRPTFGYFAFPPGAPTTVEIETWIDERYMIEVLPWGISDNDYQLKKVGAAEYDGPGLAILEIEIEGPLFRQYPLPGHHLLFDGLNRTEVLPANLSQREKSWYKPEFALQPEALIPDVTSALQRVVTRAFRRPVSEADIAPYLKLFQQELATGASAEDAWRAAVIAVFCSPGFLYFHEEPARDAATGRLDDYAVAARLSYFLTRSQPDDQLWAAARRGELTADPLSLRSAMNRLLESPQSDRFVADFTDAWLNLRDIEFTNPDEALFPEFDAYLQWSLVKETRSFFRRMLDDDLSVTRVVKSDFAMINERLAEHYGIPGISGPQIRHVRLPADSVRGGILSHASVHKVSANGTSTSPVVRGVWVMERILGTPPAPPPPGIPGVEPDVRGATTLRELLDRHRDVESCRTCHQLIDPPGFALESFDPIGGWRERFRSLGEGERVDLRLEGRRVRYKLAQPVDASGVLPDGRQFDGFVQFRDALAEDPRSIAAALTQKLLTFATGREMGFSDRREIDRIVDAAADSDFGLRSLVEGVVTSSLFLRK